MVHAWVLAGFFWQLPSWLYHLTAGEIAGVLSYLLVHALFESLVIVGLLALLAAILPSAWLRDVFVVRGTAMVLVLLPSIMIYLSKAGMKDLLNYFFVWLSLGTILTAVFTFLSARVSFLRRVIADLADRFMVFVYFQVPLVIAAVLVLLIRNVT